MRKYLSLFLLIVIPVIFTACSNEPESIVGKWSTEWVNDNGTRVFENIEFKEKGSFNTESYTGQDVFSTRGNYTFDTQTHILVIQTAWTSEKGILLEPAITTYTAYLDGKTLKVVGEDDKTKIYKKK